MSQMKKTLKCTGDTEAVVPQAHRFAQFHHFWVGDSRAVAWLHHLSHFLCYETSMSQGRAASEALTLGFRQPEQTEAGKNAFEQGSLLWSVNQPHVAGKRVKSISSRVD